MGLDTLQEFKEKISDVLHSDHDDIELQKWLTARQENVAKAEAMYRKSMQWRKDYQVDNILTTFKVPAVMSNYYATGQCGQDKQGRPLHIDSLGRLDIRGIIHSVERRDIVRYIVYNLETSCLQLRRTRSTSRRADQLVQIIDVAELSTRLFWKPAFDLYTEVLAIMADNYPELLARSFIVNVSRVAHSAFNFLKRFIDKRTSEKFIFLAGSDWHQTLLEYFDADQLPAYFGGTMKDPDGNIKCESRICYGSSVPDSLYLNAENVKFNGEVQQETISNRSVLIKQYPLTQGQCLHYQFKTQHAITFHIQRRTEITDTTQRSIKSANTTLASQTPDNKHHTGANTTPTSQTQDSKHSTTQHNTAQCVYIEAPCYTNSDIVMYEGRVNADCPDTCVYELCFSNKHSTFTNCTLKLWSSVS